MIGRILTVTGLLGALTAIPVIATADDGSNCDPSYGVCTGEPPVPPSTTQYCSIHLGGCVDSEPAVPQLPTTTFPVVPTTIPVTLPIPADDCMEGGTTRWSFNPCEYSSDLVIVEAVPCPQEDDPCWDCKTMGNLVCGPAVVLPETL